MMATAQTAAAFSMACLHGSAKNYRREADISIVRWTFSASCAGGRRWEINRCFFRISRRQRILSGHPL